MHIYVLRGRDQQGPFTLAEINTRLAAGTFSPSDLAWPEGATQWVPLDQIQGVNTAPVAVPLPPAVQEPVAPKLTSSLQQRTELDDVIRVHYSIEARKERDEQARGRCTMSGIAMIVLLGASIVLGGQEGYGLATGICLVAALAAVAATAHFYLTIGTLGEPPATLVGGPSAIPVQKRPALATFNAWLVDLRLWITAIGLFVFLGVSIYRDIKVSRENYDAIHNGMTKAEVRAVLGSPNDVTEATLDGVSVDQWVYAAASSTTSKVILIDFENGRVADKTWGGSHY